MIKKFFDIYIGTKGCFYDDEYICRQLHNEYKQIQKFNLRAGVANNEITSKEGIKL